MPTLTGWVPHLAQAAGFLTKTHWHFFR